MTRWIAIVARKIFTALCIVGLLLFLVSAFLGRFRLVLGSVVLSCRVPEKPLLLAIFFGLLVALLNRRKDDQDEEGQRGMSGSGWAAAGVASLATLFLLWSRSGYLSYYRYLIKLNDFVYPPLWLSTALYLSVGAGALVLWVKSRQSTQAVASSVGLALFVISPIAFYISNSIVVAFSITVASWLLINQLLDRQVGAPNIKVLLACLLPLATATILAIQFYGQGWSFERINDHWGDRLAPMPMLGVLAVIGIAGTIKLRGNIPGLKGACVLALVAGLPLAGSPGELGDAGAVGLVPLMLVLVGQGSELILRNRRVTRSVILKNLFLIAIIGMIIGTARLNLSNTICPPGYRYNPIPTATEENVAK